MGPKRNGRKKANCIYVYPIGLYSMSGADPGFLKRGFIIFVKPTTWTKKGGPPVPPGSAHVGRSISHQGGRSGRADGRTERRAGREKERGDAGRQGGREGQRDGDARTHGQRGYSISEVLRNMWI